MANSSHNDRCLVCDSRITRTSRGICDVFQNCMQLTNDPIHEKLGYILGVNLSEEAVHSHYICKKCYRVLEEIENLESTASQYKEDLCEKFRYAAVRRNVSLPIKQEPQDVITEIELQESDIIETGRLINAQLPNDPMGCADTIIEISTIIEDEEEVMSEDHCSQLTENGETNSLNGQILQEEGDSADSYLITYGTVEEIANNGKIGSEMLELDCSDGIKPSSRNSYKCDICQDEFITKKELMQHYLDHEASGDEFQCSVCDKVFTLFKSYQEHKRVHSGKVNTCTICKHTYGTMKELEEHQENHVQEQIYTCLECSKTYAVESCYKAHMKQHMGNYHCKLCEKRFLNLLHYHEHEKKHVAGENFACSTCGKVFTTQKSLDLHLPVHGVSKPFRCQFCGKGFLRKPQLANHERTHTGEKPYQCEECGATFCQRSNLYSHKKYTHEQDKKYKCELCGKGFKRRRLLNWHRMSVHTGEKPLICEICGTGFVYPGHLKKHMIIHTGEKPWKCGYCGKGFASKDNRNAHQYIHTDRKPYECGICQQGFMRKPMLLNHLNEVHPHFNSEMLVENVQSHENHFVNTTGDQAITEITVPMLSGQGFRQILHEGQAIVVTHHRANVEPVVEIHAGSQDLTAGNTLAVTHLQ